MKKIFYSLTVVFVSLFFVNTTTATQGTCSSHGGVNCGAGWDYDGSAICNDGWRDSSESYFDQSACKNYETCPLEKMATESYFTCASDEMLETLKQNKMSGLPKLNPTTESGSFNFDNNFSSEEEQLMYYYGDEIRKCEEDIARFKKAWADYNNCHDQKWANWSKAMDNYLQQQVDNINQTTQGNKLVEEILNKRSFTTEELNSLNLEQLTYLNTQLENLLAKDKWCQTNQNAPSYNRNTGKCDCATNAYLDQSSQSCKYCPLNSVLNNEKTGCSCKESFVVNSSKTFCVSKDQYCKESLSNSHYNTSEQACSCNDGFSYNESKNTCEAVKEEVQEVNSNNNLVEEVNTPKPVEKTPIKSTPIKIPETQAYNKEIELLGTDTTTENIANEPTTTLQITEDTQIENEPQPTQEKPIIQKIKEGTSSAVKHVVSFVKNVFSKLKFW